MTQEEARTAYYVKEDGYKIKNMLRLTIGSRNDNLKFMEATKDIFRK